MLACPGFIAADAENLLLRLLLTAEFLAYIFPQWCYYVVWT